MRVSALSAISLQRSPTSMPSEFEPEQHRGGVLHVDVEVGLRLRQRAGEIAEAPVVEIEHRVELAPLQMKQRAVPPQMMQQVVAAVPVPLQLVEPRDAFGVAALHLHDVRDRVRAPDVARIDRDRGAARRLGARIVAALFQRETMAREDRAVARQVARPFRLHALDRGAHLARPAEPEIVEMREAKREHVERMLAQDLLPDAERAVEIAGDPGIERRDMRLLARCCIDGEPPRRAARPRPPSAHSPACRTASRNSPSGNARAPNSPSAASVSPSRAARSARYFR